MKTLTRIIQLLIFTSVLFMACQKETSFEKGNTRASVGSLSVDGNGNCLGGVVSGTYYKDTSLKTSNYVDISVQVDTAGSYTISSDTVNGYHFKATGTFSATGTQVIRLLGGGKPLVIGTNIFTVTYNGTTCEFSVNVTAASGGSAAFTVNCSSAIPAGTYQVGTALTSANTITLNVTVTTTGTWSITTGSAVNGVTFAGSGTFTTTGAQTIVLTGSGTPVAGGPFNFPITVGTSTCNFPCTFTTIPDYFPRTAYSNWSYNQNDGVNTDTLLYKVIPETKTVGANTYNIFMYTYDASTGFDTLGYYRRSGGDYFEWGDISYGILDSPVRDEDIFLKDNQTVGATWMSPQFSGAYTDQTSGNTFNITLRWEFTIVQQNATVTVGTTSYPNTIQVKQELKQLVSGNWTLAFYFQNYYARDKGLIKQDLFDATGTSLYAQDVKRLVIY